MVLGARDRLNDGEMDFEILAEIQKARSGVRAVGANLELVAVSCKFDSSRNVNAYIS